MGESIDLVIQVLGCASTGTEARELWFGVDCIIAESLSTGIWTLYGYRVVSTAGFVLEASSDSQKFRKPEDPASHVVPVKEVCAGLGGISMGAKQLGFQSLAMLDINSLAMKSAALNGTNMLQDDLTTCNAKRRLHAIAPEKACLLLAGFPCQPFSRQGDGRGFADMRAQPFIHVLLLAWFLQPQGLVLECVTEAGRHPIIRCLLAEISAKMGWSQHQLVMDLAEQWPCRRLRWWCVLLPGDSPNLLEAWPTHQVGMCIQDVIPEWPAWPEHEVEQLRWDEDERQHFLSPEFGSDPRQLNQLGIAPTLLHSCGSQLRSCPCGCRGPLSQHRLRAAGLRGFGVLLGDGSFRHPHPQEASLLNGLSVRYRHNPDLRAALCQIGQLASPIQACWVFAQVRQFREVRHLLPHLDPPCVELAKLKQSLLQERLDDWILPSMSMPRQLVFQLADTACVSVIQVRHAAQAFEIARAETQLCGPGQCVSVHSGKRRLGDSSPSLGCCSAL